MYPEWSKWDEKDLALYVNPDAVNLLGKLPENPYDMPEDPDGRKRILELIYDKLLESGVSYALEKFSYADDVQKIRAGGEILSGAARGTCLDLSLLFAGLAEGYDLVPVVVLTEGHAFVIVSLKNGRREWDSFGRSELEEFTEPVREIEVLRSQVNDGSYLAVECTGFAASEKLRDNPDQAYPETLGRNEKGLMPFEQALTSGKAQLFDRPEDLGFALDITVAHRHKEPLEIGIATSIVSERQQTEAVVAGSKHGKASVAVAGEDQVELDMRSDHGAKVNPVTEEESPTVFELPVPIKPRVKPLKGLVGRESEKGLIRAAMDDEETVGVYSGNGWGKTALMRSIAYAGTDEFPDGVVYLKVPKQPVEDVLQDLHDQFYRADEPAKPSLATIKQRLADKRAVVILDELGMDADSVENLTFALPESFYVLASETPSPFGEARPLQLGGLSADEALAFLQKRLGIELAEEERDAAREICKTLDNHPGHLIEAGNAVLGGRSLAEVARSYQGAAEPSAEVAEAVRADLSPIQQKVADILSVAQVPLSLELLERVLADDLTDLPDGLHDAIRALIASERVEAHSPRFSLTSTVAEGAARHWNPTDWMGALLSNLAGWFESEEVTSDLINRDRKFIIRALEWGIEAEKWTEVVRVAKAVDRGIALGRHWGAWEQVLEHALEAAEQMGEAGESARAWAHHQLGSRAIGIGDDAAALEHLTEALEIRERLGEKNAVKMTRHNLNLVTPTPPIRAGMLAAAIGGVLALVLLGLGVSAPPWINHLNFDPPDVVFSNIAIDDSERRTVEFVNPTDRDITGIQLSVAPSAGEFAVSQYVPGVDPVESVAMLASDAPLAASHIVQAQAARPCDLGNGNVIDLDKESRCYLVVEYRRSQAAPAAGTLAAQLAGEAAIEATLRVADGTPPTAGGGTTGTGDLPTTASTLPPTTAPTLPPTTVVPPITVPSEPTTTIPPTLIGQAEPDRAAIDFRDVQVGRTVEVTFTVANTGGGALAFSGFDVEGSPEFSAEGEGCLAEPLVSGESCSATVTFTPSEPETTSVAILVLAHDGVGGTTELPMSGRGVEGVDPGQEEAGVIAQAVVDISGEFVTFDGPGPQAIRVANVGTVPVTIEGLTEPEHFTVSGCVGAPLAPGGSCTLEVTFDGTAGLHCEILELLFDGKGERRILLKAGS